MATRALDWGLVISALWLHLGPRDAGHLPLLGKESVGLTGWGRAGVAKEERSRLSRFSLC